MGFGAVRWSGVKQQLEDPSTSVQNVARHHRLLDNHSSLHPFPNIHGRRQDLIFEMEGKVYLLAVGYFSRYVEVQTLANTTSASVISARKALFSQIPATLVSDNGSQYSSQEF